MKTEIYHEKTEVISSGSFITFDTSPVTISLRSDAVESTASRIIFVFKKDEQNKQALKASKVVDGALEITLINFSNPLGIGYPVPLEIGKDSAEKKVYLSFMVYAFANCDQHKISYTIYKDR